MKKYLVGSLLALSVWACASEPNSPEHVTEVFLTALNARKFDLAYQFIGGPDMMQMAPLLTKNYTLNKITFTGQEVAKDSATVRLKSILFYKDGTYVDLVFLLHKYKYSWRIQSI